MYGNAAFMMTVAIGSATTIRVSHAYGRRDAQELHDAVVSSVHLGALWGAIVLVSFVALNQIMPMAFTTNCEVIALGANLIVLVALYQVSDAVQGTMVGVLRGMQDVKIIAGLSFVAYVLLNIPVGYLCAFVFDMGAEGLMVGYIVGLTTAAIAYSVRVWRHLRQGRLW
jgi:MATE family multidrug resistance protein